MIRFLATIIFFITTAAHAQHQHVMVPQIKNPLKEIESAADHKQKAESENANDTRKALPLLGFMAEHQKKNMRAHLEAIRDIVSGYADKNFKNIKEAALRLGSSPQMNMMCDHMGQASPGFTPMALKMHSNADTIVAAAEKKDFNAVVTATEKTLQSCTSCHAAYKQQIVSDEEWNKMVNKK